MKKFIKEVKERLLNLKTIEGIPLVATGGALIFGYAVGKALLAIGIGLCVYGVIKIIQKNRK